MTSYSDARLGLRHIFLRDLTVLACLGVHAHEQAAPQRVVINIDLAVQDEAAPDGVGEDRLARVVDYARLVDLARRIATQGPIRLVETLAERIAMDCLADPRVQAARVRVEKPDILADARSVGVCVERRRT